MLHAGAYGWCNPIPMGNTARDSDDLDPTLALPQRRYIALVSALAEDGWTQTRIGRALGVSQSYISQILRGRGPAVTVQRIEAAIAGLPIDRSYFTDPDVDERGYKALMGKRPRRTESGVAPAPSDEEPSEGWRKFVSLGLDRVYMARGLTGEDLDYVQRAPGRKGLKNLDFYVDLCNTLVRGVDPHPDFDALPDEEVPEARRLIRRRGEDEDEGDDD